MIITKALKQDLPAIQELMQESGKMVVTPEHLNNRDIALQARIEDGQLIGFIWCGLMANGKIGYIDKFAVKGSWSHKKVGHLLMLALKNELVKKNVREVFGVIRRDKHHDKSAMNALRGAMGAHSDAYTYVEACVANAVKDLESLEK